MAYKYPTREEIAADVANETTAINVAITAMSEALDNCPLPDHVKVYAACELACKLGDTSYVEDVLNEIILLRKINGTQLISQSIAIEKLQAALTRLEYYALRSELPPQEAVDFAMKVGFETMPHKIVSADPSENDAS